MESLKFTVPGKPVPQGSMKAFAVRSKAGYTGKTIVTHGNVNALSAYRDDIRMYAMRAMRTARMPEPYRGAVELFAAFYFKRPKSHLKSNGTHKASAPIFHTQTPDLDKLLRSVGDALTGTVIVDDKQIAFYNQNTGKYWSDCDGTDIVIFFR